MQRLAERDVAMDRERIDARREAREVGDGRDEQQRGERQVVPRGRGDRDRAAVRKAEERDRFDGVREEIARDGGDVVVLVQVEAEDPLALAVTP